MVTQTICSLTKTGTDTRNLSFDVCLCVCVCVVTGLQERLESQGAGRHQGSGRRGHLPV